MTLVRFYENSGNITGFLMSGHSSHSQNDIEGKLVCAAVSSAAYMAVNTLTEVIGAECVAKVGEAKMQVTVNSKLEDCQSVLKGFRLHIESLKKQYKNNIQVITEV